MIGKPENMKKVNVNLIYKAFAELNSATRLEISEKTQISLTTIKALLDELLEENQILETQLDESNGGRRAQRYTLNHNNNLILSLYFENDRLVYQVSNLNNHILEKGEQKFNIMNVLKFLRFIENCLIRFNICAIGIGVPGIVEDKKFYVGCENGEFEINNIGDIIQEKYNIPVVLENDLNAIAYGYAIHYLYEHDECSVGTVNLAYIHFNKTCTGAGFVTDGKIIHGAQQFAGELGFMPIEEKQTLDQVLDLKGEFENCIDAISRTLAIINCVTNPALIVIGGDRFENCLVDPNKIELYLKQNYLSEKMCPRIIVSDCIKEDYLLGIKELTFNHIIEMLPI